MPLGKSKEVLFRQALLAQGNQPDMNYSLNSLKGGYRGDHIGYYYRVVKGDTRSLDYSSYCEALCMMTRYDKAMQLKPSLDSSSWR